MATKVTFKTTFAAAKTIEPIFTGGDISHNADGSLLATCVEEDVLIVDIRSGKVLCRIEGDGEPVTSLCLAPDISHLAIASRSLSLRIYSLTTVEGSTTLVADLARTLKPHTTPVVSSAIDGTGSVLATGGAEGQVKVWDLRGGYVSHTFHGHGGVVSALRFFRSKSTSSASSQKSRKRKSRDGEQMDVDEPSPVQQICLASGGEDGKIRVWNLSTRKAIATLDAHVSVVRSIDFTEDQQLLLTASRDRTIILWDTPTWKQTRVIPALEVVETAGFLVAGKFCYAGGEHGAVRIWDVTTGRELTAKQKPGLENDAIMAIVPVFEDNTVISVHQDQTMRVHDITKLQELQVSESMGRLPVIRTISGNYDEVIDMACVGPERRLLALATNTESVRLVSIAEDSTQEDTNHSSPSSFGNDVALLEGHEDIIICLDVDWSGHWLATGAKDNTARLWRLDPASSSYTCFAVLAGHAESLGAIALPRSPPSDGPALRNPAGHAPAFLLTGSQDKTIKRWDTAKLKYDPSATEPQNSVKALFTRVAHDKDINAIDVSPTSALFASASQDRTIKVWSLEDGSVAGILRGHKRGVWSIRFSPSGTPPIPLPDGGSSGSRGLLVSGSGDRTVKVWSLSTYTCLQTFEGHSNSVLKVIWISPGVLTPRAEESGEDAPRPAQQNESPVIASASSDTLVKLWSPYSAADSDHLLTTLDNHTDRVWALVAPTSYPGRSHPASPKSSKGSSTPTTKQTYPYPLISGAADATLTFWRDTTLATASALSHRATQRIEQDQLLQNHIFTKNYREAITLSLALNHPGRLLRVFQDVVEQNGNEAGDEDGKSITGAREVDAVLASLDRTQLFQMLEHVRDWNTNARTAPVAQRVLHCILKSYPKTTFVETARDKKLVGNAGGGDGAVAGTVTVTGRRGAKARGSAGMQDLLRALEVYTERHFKRMEELIDESYLIEYTLREMDEGIGPAMESSNGQEKGNGVDVDRDADVIMV
ncbi:putative U3 small nucleolar RNA-associated protein 13 [Cladophialophora carrionii]|uniref:Putative U3 small nucleolar RNA-associated protein 13 n=1 Tax=Cladophialophora carrionii TaxID=86049 RepID=A0A1C1D0Z7_9EURO|nr:putative U3 small nucleolar RNA-associated protein 13 [Cladophialophora carrionii]